VQGEPTEKFSATLRDTLTRIVLDSGDAIARFKGDSRTIPSTVNDAIAGLVSPREKHVTDRRTSKPYFLIVALAILVFLILVPVRINWHRNRTDREVETRALLALTSSPLLRSDRLTVKVDRDTVRVSGVVPNMYLRGAAEKIVKQLATERNVINTVLVADTPPFALLTLVKIKEVGSVLNRIDGVSVVPRSSDSSVVIEGSARDSSLRTKVAEAFVRLPGIVSFQNNLVVREPDINTRIYFDFGSTYPKSGQALKLASFRDFLIRDEEGYVRVIGHADKRGTTIANQRIALGRANTVRDFLTREGISATRLRAEGSMEPAPGTSGSEYDSLSRCVRFELLPFAFRERRQ
jgi:outer membrane protein OmpA-like peptidoglycan-associated protein